jgi:hypothetical protein
VAGVSVNVVGARELRKKLRKLGDDLEDMKAVHLAAAELVADEAERRVPVKTGTLRMSIKAAGTKTKGKVRAASTGKSKPYGARQHWAQQKGKPGDQFIYKAMGAKGRDVVKLYHERVDALVDRMNRYGSGGTF